MPYCKHCGNKIIPNARFCSSCSAPMDEESRVEEQDKVIDDEMLHIDRNERINGYDVDESSIGLMDLPEDSEHLLPRFKEPKVKKKNKGLFGLFKK